MDVKPARTARDHRSEAVHRQTPPGMVWLRRGAGLLGALYLLMVWLDAAGVRAPERALPLSVRLFVQVAELFPHAAEASIDWRARGWSCERGVFEELDVRPFFPIHRDDKESRFYRAMFFHYRDHRVLEALDTFIVRQQNRQHPTDRIGGVMLLSLRIPLPPLGAREPPFRRLPLSDYPASVPRRYWYVTSSQAREQRCTEAP